MAKIKAGGQCTSLSGQKIESIEFICEEPRAIHCWINESSVSYLTLDEAMDLRDALNEAISQAVSQTKNKHGQ